MENQQEEWRWIPGFEQKYMISSLGFVKNIKTNRLLQARITNKGYNRSRLYKNSTNIKDYPVHRLVANAFIPNPQDKPYVNHKNFNKLDNRAENLEWVTPQENSFYTNEHNGPNSIRGVKNWKAKLTVDNVLEIRRLAQNGIQTKYIVKQFGISRIHVRNIVKKKSWKHLKEEEVLIV